MSLNIVIGFFVFVIGLCIGSFLNVVILRALSGESIVFPASKCPKCQTPLKWWHNLPVISYLFLRGKCAFCKEKISIQYPIIELLTAYLFLTAYLKFGFGINMIFICLFLSMFIVIAMTDIKEQVAFDIHCYILAFFGLIYNFFNFGQLYSGHTWIFNTSFVASILGLLLGAGIIGIYFGLGYLIVRAMVIGAGDIFIAGALGACFGWKFIIPILICAFVLQALMVIPVFINKLFKNKDYTTIISFTAFILIAIVYYVYSNYINIVNTAIDITLSILLAGVGIFVCKKIISSIPKNIQTEETNSSDNGETPSSDKNESDSIKIPFGPALVCAGILFIFLF